MSDRIPGAWTEAELEYDFQQERWQNEESGNFLVLESRKEPDGGGTLTLSLISEKFSERPEPIRTIVDRAESYNYVVREAFEFMGDHPKGCQP